VTPYPTNAIKLCNAVWYSDSADYTLNMFVLKTNHHLFSSRGDNREPKSTTQETELQIMIFYWSTIRRSMARWRAWSGKTQTIWQRTSEGLIRECAAGETAWGPGEGNETNDMKGPAGAIKDAFTFRHLSLAVGYQYKAYSIPSSSSTLLFFYPLLLASSSSTLIFFYPTLLLPLLFFYPTLLLPLLFF